MVAALSRLGSLSQVLLGNMKSKVFEITKRRIYFISRCMEQAFNGSIKASAEDHLPLVDVMLGESWFFLDGEAWVEINI